MNIGESKIKDCIFTSSCANIGLTEKIFRYNTYTKGAISTITEKIFSNIEIEIHKKTCNFSDHVILGINILKMPRKDKYQYCYQLLLIKEIQERIKSRMNKRNNTLII
ncbi:hypothetical protein DMUE_1969 [Dictyocoela muelleri]|nr:hypothetical protein DMUE_1969 [Dictyocoela muelleri]